MENRQGVEIKQIQEIKPGRALDSAQQGKGRETVRMVGVNGIGGEKACLVSRGSV